MNPPNGSPVLVIGGGIAGLTAAVELAETGVRVILVEKTASLGGRVARLHQYFPKLCPPTCGLEMHYRRIRGNPAITVLTRAEVTELTGEAGAYDLTVRLTPRHVSEACTLCDACTKVCPAERRDRFNYDMQTTKAVYLPHGMAYPSRYVIDRSVCQVGCKACQDACTYGAIKLDQEPETRKFHVSAVVAASGWTPYDATQLVHLGFGSCSNVVTNVMLERMAAIDGPTGGKIVRPSDGKEPRTVAFVQCAGSRDENHLPYCSAVCCAASVKHAAYIRAQYPETAITMFYIDVRTPGKLEEFKTKIAEDPNFRLIRGKVARVEENPGTADLLVTAEDVLATQKSTMHFELVVLATGMVPSTAGLPAAIARDELGFLMSGDRGGGIYAAGCVHRPADVAASVEDATGVSLKALQTVRRSAGGASQIGGLTYAR